MLDRLESSRPSRQAALIAAAGLFMLLLVFKAPFLNYDDPCHVYENQLVVSERGVADYFTRGADHKWFPVTFLTYRLDYLLFQSWMPDTLGSWAPGVRFMNYVYHTIAAIFVWRVLLLLGLLPLPALFGGIFFVAHPMACETVCWAAERKTALAGLFGFGALWAWIRLDGSLWRVPATSGLYLLANMSKGSALGLLPVILLIEIMGGAARFRGETPVATPVRQRWLAGAARLAPLLAISLAAIGMNMHLHDSLLVPHAGGSLFTALLTDAPILTRYLFNSIVPLRLSFAYYVEPVTSIASPRFMLHAGILLAAAGVTLWLAPNRRRALLGWLWLIAALGPTLNIVSISNLMQDRFFYFSMPGLLLVLLETASGIAQRVKVDRTALRKLAAAYILILSIAGMCRGQLFASLIDVFNDAVAKHPRSSHARHMLSLAYLDAFVLAQQDQAAWSLDAGRQRLHCDTMMDQTKHHKLAFFSCPDAERQLNYTPTALDAGDYCLEKNQLKRAEEFWQSAALGPIALPVHADIRSQALCRLAEQRLLSGKLDAAYDYAQQAVAADPTLKIARLFRARLSLDLAKREWEQNFKPQALALVAFARRDLESISHQPCELLTLLQTQLDQTALLIQ